MFNKTDLLVRFRGNYGFTTEEDLTYHNKNTGKHYNVPYGTDTDLVSSPRAMWSLIPPMGKYTCAAILHDYLYQTGKVSRKEADKVFLHAMESLGVSKIKRNLMYRTVRIFGANQYNG